MTSTFYVGYEDWYDLPQYVTYTDGVLPKIKPDPTTGSRTFLSTKRITRSDLGGGNDKTIGGAASNTDDLSRLLQMHLNKGVCGGTEVLSQANVREMQKGHVDPYWTYPQYWVDGEVSDRKNLECPVTARRKVLINGAALFVADQNKLTPAGKLFLGKAAESYGEATLAAAIHGVGERAKQWEVLNYGLGWYLYEFKSAPGVEVLVTPGGWGARLVLVPEEGWGAVFILEANTVIGDDLLAFLFPRLWEAVNAVLP